MKKQMLKKVYAMVLAITLIGSQQCSSVLANDIAQIYSGVTQNTEIPDYDYWMAQTIMNGIDNNGNSLYSTFRSFSEPVYRQLGEYLLDDKPLVSISTAWSIYFNSEYRNQLTNMQKYVYEMLLMDYLKYDAFGEDKNKELTNSKTDFALKIYDAIGEELNDKKESYINNLPVKESKEICRRIETIYGLGEVLKGVNEGIKTTSMRWIYGSAFSQYGSIMEFKRNGEFSYGVGAGNGGAGKFSIKNNYIKYRIIKYEDNAVEQKSIKVKKINSQNIRLIIKDGKYKIYWKKKS